MSSMLPRRYALAAYAVAVKLKEEHSFFGDIQFLLDFISKYDVICEIMKNPLLDESKKKELLNNILASRGDESISKTIYYLLDVIISNRCCGQIFEIVKECIDLCHYNMGICQVTISTAVALDGSIAAELVDKAESIIGKKVKPEFKVDEDIIGGYKLDIDSYQYDATLKSQIIDIKRVLMVNGKS